MKYLLLVTISSLCIWILLGFLIFGCGSPISAHPTPEVVQSRSYMPKIDERIKGYVEEFKGICDLMPSATCLERWSKLDSISIVDMETLRKEAKGERWVGVCWEWTDSNKNLIRSHIQILNNDGHGSDWDKDALKGLVYHELGHCLLRLEHTSSFANNPKMMNPSMYPTSVYINNWDNMVKEMFSTQYFTLSAELPAINGELTLTAHPITLEQL